LQTFKPGGQQVEITEIFEEYDAESRMSSRRIMELQVSFVEKAAFEQMAQDAGFQVLSLHGDYSGSAFEEATSPLMIWTLGRA
jgi:hypothetical protein